MDPSLESLDLLASLKARNLLCDMLGLGFHRPTGRLERSVTLATKRLLVQVEMHTVVHSGTLLTHGDDKSQGKIRSSRCAILICLVTTRRIVPLPPSLVLTAAQPGFRHVGL